jgi:uncharacterized membrane protein required for colicin V production
LRTVDLLIVVLLLAAVAWGYRQGLSGYAIALIGFGIGAVIGSRVAPLILDQGYKDPFAPVIALPGALLFGAVFAAAFERFGIGLQRRIRRWGRIQQFAGALLAACLGLVAVWILGALASRAHSLRKDVRASRIVEKLDAVLPAPGPLLHPENSHVDDRLRVVSGPSPNIGPIDPLVTRDPQLRAAAASSVKIYGDGCGGGRTGSGWVARDGIVVTNAHVVRDTRDLWTQVKGKGGLNDGTVIWFDPVNDVALIQSPGVRGVPALRLGRDPKGDTYAAVVGYPGGGRLRITPARTGAATRDPAIRVDGEPVKNELVPLRAPTVKPGSSGSPIVDRHGRVRSMVFAGGKTAIRQWGVPTGPMRRALRRAGPPVSHGRCN